MSSFRLAKRKKVPIFEWTSPLIKVKSVMNWWKNFRWTPCLYFSIPFTVVHFFPDKCHGVLAKMGLLKVSKCPESLSYLELINFKLRALTLERNINISDQVSLYDNLKDVYLEGSVQYNLSASINNEMSSYVYNCYYSAVTKFSVTCSLVLHTWPIANLLLCGCILSTTGNFIRSINGKSSILSCNCYM